VTEASVGKGDLPGASGIRSILPEVVILFLGCVLLFTELGARSLWYLEGRWAETTDAK